MTEREMERLLNTLTLEVGYLKAKVDTLGKHAFNPGSVSRAALWDSWQCPAMPDREPCNGNCSCGGR